MDGGYLENRFFLASWIFRHYELDAFSIPKIYSMPDILSRKYIHPIVWSILKKIIYGKRYIQEKNGTLVQYFPANAYLDGWFQSYKYFDTYINDIQKLFQVQTEISPKNQSSLDVIAQAGKKSISLHVRRGDYVTLAGANKWHWVCSLGYYESAIAQMIEKLYVPVFFVFSDDIEWCKSNIVFPEGIVAHYIDHNGNKWHEDMRLMYSCAHHIIANSSFSWWWAYLGQNPDKTIIAPKKWLQTDTFNTQNLIPPSWILL